MPKTPQGRGLPWCGRSMPRSSPHFSTGLSLHNTSYTNIPGRTVESAVGLLSPVPAPPTGQPRLGRPPIFESLAAGRERRHRNRPCALLERLCLLGGSSEIGLQMLSICSCPRELKSSSAPGPSELRSSIAWPRIGRIT